jgi:hypothetical protein
METMNRRPEEFDSPTDPKFLTLLKASEEGNVKVGKEDIKEEWNKTINGINYTVFGIEMEESIRYFGLKIDHDKQKISPYKGNDLAKEILKSLEGVSYENTTLSIDQVTNDLVIALPGEPAIRIPEEGDPSSN